MCAHIAASTRAQLHTYVCTYSCSLGVPATPQERMARFSGASPPRGLAEAQLPRVPAAPGPLSSRLDAASLFGPEPPSLSPACFSGDRAPGGLAWQDSGLGAAWEPSAAQALSHRFALLSAPLHFLEVYSLGSAFPGSSLPCPEPPALPVPLAPGPSWVMGMRPVAVSIWEGTAPGENIGRAQLQTPRRPPPRTCRGSCWDGGAGVIRPHCLLSWGCVCAFGQSPLPTPPRPPVQSVASPWYPPITWAVTQDVGVSGSRRGRVSPKS